MRIQSHKGRKGFQQPFPALLLLSLCCFTGLFVQATAPTIGITTFNNLTPGALLGLTPTPGTSPNVGGTGWDFTIGTGGGNVSMSIAANGAVPGGVNDYCIRLNRNTSGDFVLYTSVKSNDGSAFSLQYAYLKINLVLGSSADMTITGYRSGVAVAGATKTITGILNNPVWTQFDVSAISAFNNVDEFRFTQASSSTSEISFEEIDQIDIASAVLPLTLTNFSGQLQGNEVQLNWTTAMEENTSYFEILRSPDGTRFEPAGRVSAAGNSSILRQYQYIDVLPADAPPALFYQLQMTDLDGQSTYSPILKISPPTSRLQVQVAPNPFLQSVNVFINATGPDNAAITLTDMQGRSILATTMPMQKGNNVITLKSLQQLGQGIYLLHIATRTNHQTIQLLKEK